MTDSSNTGGDPHRNPRVAGGPLESRINYIGRMQLLSRAKECARACFYQSGWSMEGAVQGAVDDTSDDRSEYSNFDGPRHVAYDYLDSRRAEIEWALWEQPHVR